MGQVLGCLHRVLIALLLPAIAFVLYYLATVLLSVEVFEVVGIGVAAIGGPALISAGRRGGRESRIRERAKEISGEAIHEWVSRIRSGDATDSRRNLIVNEDAIRNAFSELIRPGCLMFNPPVTMRLGRTERVEVRMASSSRLRERIVEDLRGQGSPQVEDIQIAPVMAVALKGESFQIIPYSLEEQRIVEDKLTTWEFDISASRHGRQRLVICVSLRVPVPGEPWDRMSIPVREVEINVEVTRVAIVLRFAMANWQWLVGTVIGIVAVVVVVI